MSDRSLAASPLNNVSTKPKKSLRVILQLHPLVTFFAIGYTISWLALLGLFLGGPLNTQSSELPVSFLLLAILSSYGPALAALFMQIIGAKRSEINQQQYQLRGWRINSGWYWLSLLLPAAIVLTGAALAAFFNNGSIALQIPSVFVIFLGVINLGRNWAGAVLPCRVSWNATMR